MTNTDPDPVAALANARLFKALYETFKGPDMTERAAIELACTAVDLAGLAQKK